MTSVSDNVAHLQAQLAQKSELVALLTEQLEKTATQLDRLTRAGAERTQQSSSSSTSSPVSAELTQRLASALDNWEEFQPAERLERIESGIEKILEMLSRQPAEYAASGPAQKTNNEDFWALTKQRLFGEMSEDSPSYFESERESERPSSSNDSQPDSLMGLVQEINAAPEPPGEISPMADTKELLNAIKSRDEYIQYLTGRLRLVESEKFKPANWEMIADAPDDYRKRLEALEEMLKDHLRQAEVSHSLERAMLARERAKLAHVKQNLELQIRKLAMPDQTQVLPTVTGAPPQGSQSGSREPSETPPESRWKRIFSR